MRQLKTCLRMHSKDISSRRVVAQCVCPLRSSCVCAPPLELRSPQPAAAHADQEQGTLGVPLSARSTKVTVKLLGDLRNKNDDQTPTDGRRMTPALIGVFLFFALTGS